MPGHRGGATFAPDCPPAQAGKRADLSGVWRQNPKKLLQRGIERSGAPIAHAKARAQPDAVRPGQTGRLCAWHRKPAARAPHHRPARTGLVTGRSTIMQVRHILQNKGHDVVAVAASADLCEAVRILSQHRIGALLVRAQGGALAGILSERDVVRAIAATGGAALSQSVQQHMTAKLITCTEDDSVEDHHGSDDQRPFPSCAGAGPGRRSVRHDLDRRRGEIADRGGGWRSRCTARLYLRRG